MEATREIDDIEKDTPREIEDIKKNFIILISYLRGEELENLCRFESCVKGNPKIFDAQDNTEKYLLTWVVKFNKESFTSIFFQAFNRYGLNHLLTKEDKKGNNSLHYAAIYNNADFIKFTKGTSKPEYDSKCLILAIENGSLGFLNGSLLEDKFSYELIIQALIKSYDLKYQGAYDIFEKKYHELLENKRSDYIKKYPIFRYILPIAFLLSDGSLKLINYVLGSYYSSDLFMNNIRYFEIADIKNYLSKKFQSVDILNFKGFIPKPFEGKIENLFIGIKELCSLFLKFPKFPNIELKAYDPPSIQVKDETNDFIIPENVEQIFLNESAKKALSVIGENVAGEADSVRSYHRRASNLPVSRSRSASGAVNSHANRLNQSLSSFPTGDTATAGRLTNTGSSSSSQQSLSVIGENVAGEADSVRSYHRRASNLPVSRSRSASGAVNSHANRLNQSLSSFPTGDTTTAGRLTNTGSSSSSQQSFVESNLRDNGSSRRNHDS